VSRHHVALGVSRTYTLVAPLAAACVATRAVAVPAAITIPAAGSNFTACPSVIASKAAFGSLTG